MITAVLLSAAAVLAAAPAASTSSESTLPTFEVSSLSAHAGDEVTVKIETKNNPGIVSLRLMVNYDKNNMTLTNAVEKDFSGVNFGDISKFPFRFLWLDVSNGNVTTNGTVAELTFKISNSAADGVYPIEISYDPSDINNYDEQSIAFDIVNGEITVGEGGATVSLPDVTTSSQSGGNTSYPELGRHPTLPGGRDPEITISTIEIDITASEFMERHNNSNSDPDAAVTPDADSSSGKDESGSGSELDLLPEADDSSVSDGNAEDGTKESTDTSTDPASAQTSAASDGKDEDGSGVSGIAIAIAAAAVVLITGAVIVVRRKRR